MHGPRLHAPHDGLGVVAEEGGTLSWWAKTPHMHPEHTPSETHGGYLPDPSAPQVQGGGLIKSTKESQEDGILRTWGRGASISSGTEKGLSLQRTGPAGGFLQGLLDFTRKACNQPPAYLQMRLDKLFLNSLGKVLSFPDFGDRKKLHNSPRIL